MATPEQIALQRSRQNESPNTNFNTAWDLNWIGKLKGLCGRGATCTNTATGFYYPERTTAGSKNLLTNPKKAGFKIVDLKRAVPGSIIVISNPDGTERHSVIFDSVHRGKPYWYYDPNDKNLYYVLDGDTLVNYSNGKHGPENYRKRVPLNKAFVSRINHIYLLSRKYGGNIIERFRNQRKYKRGGTFKFQNSGTFPKTVDTFKGNYVPSGLKVIKINQTGGTLSRQRKLDILKHSYIISPYNSELISVTYPYRLKTYSKYPEIIDSDFDWYINEGNAIYSPLGEGVTVTGYTPLKLETYYPMIHPLYDSEYDSPFKYTGHSLINGNGVVITKDFDDDDYNLITNNCSDSTRECLEAIFNKKLDYNFFTTPGDVRDFALLNGGKSKDNRTIIIPMNKERYDRLMKFLKTKKETGK